MIDYTGKDVSWRPRLQGRTVAIIASGPSLTREQCDTVQATNWYSIAINQSWMLAPWAEMLYGCDWHWWRSETAPGPAEYRGLRVVGNVPMDDGKRRFPPDMRAHEKRMHFAPVKVGANELITEGHEIGSGSNSGFQAFNLAINCGARRIVLLGVDCHSANHHWHPPHTHKEAGGVGNHGLIRWIKSWDSAREEVQRRGVDVVNCSPGSAVTAFPRIELGKYIKREQA